MKSVKVIITDNKEFEFKIDDKDVGAIIKMIKAFEIKQTDTKKFNEPSIASTVIDFNSYYPNAFFKDIYNYLITFPIKKIKPKKVMLCFYTFSNKDRTKRSLGLAWLYYPTNAIYFRVFLRNIKQIKYPESLTEKIVNYKINNRGFPTFTIQNESDVKVTKQLIQFAYENY